MCDKAQSLQSLGLEVGLTFYGLKFMEFTYSGRFAGFIRL